MFCFFYSRKVDQGHEIQLSQWCPSIANVKMYKIVQRIFALAFTVLGIITLRMLDLGKITSRSRSATYAMVLFDGKYHYVYKLSFAVCASSNRLGDSTI